MEGILTPAQMNVGRMKQSFRHAGQSKAKRVFVVPTPTLWYVGRKKTKFSDTLTKIVNPDIFVKKINFEKRKKIVKINFLCERLFAELTLKSNGQKVDRNLSDRMQKNEKVNFEKCVKSRYG